VLDEHAAEEKENRFFEPKGGGGSSRDVLSVIGADFL
jgi:hypothetical protein